MPTRPPAPLASQLAGVQLVFEPHASQSSKDYVLDGLSLYNVAVTGLADYHPVNFFLKGYGGEIRGGLIGYIWGRWLYVNLFWVAEPLRRGGHGTRMMDAAEAYALEQGCLGAHLDTFSFQARPFYEKRGYRVFGTIEDFPPGHARYFLYKRFGGAVQTARRKARGPGATTKRTRPRKPTASKLGRTR